MPARAAAAGRAVAKGQWGRPRGARKAGAAGKVPAQPGLCEGKSGKERSDPARAVRHRSRT